MTMLVTTLVMSLIFLGTSSRLSGLLKSVPEEYENLKLTRTFGSDPLPLLNGNLYRVGPGIFEHGGRRVGNVLDGLAKIHGWKFNGGDDVSYTAKMVKSKVYNRTITEGRITIYSMMGWPEPDFSSYELAQMVLGGLDYSDNTNIAVWNIGSAGSITVTTESYNMHQVAVNTLTYNQPWKLPGTNMVSLFSGAHFCKHPNDGSSFNYVAKLSYSFFSLAVNLRYDFYQYKSTDGGEIETRKVASLEAPLEDIRIIHAFSITENFLVVPRWNYKFDFVFDPSMITKMAHLCEAFSFEYNKPTYVDIIDIVTGHTIQFELPIQKAVHGMNAFERRNEAGDLEIVMDYPTLTSVHDLDLNRHCLFDIFNVDVFSNSGYLYNDIPWDTTLRRFVFNLNTFTSYTKDFPQVWRPQDSHVEFPFINPAYNGKEYCYAYFQQWHFGTEVMDLMKYDLCKEEAITWHQDNMHVLEPVFVAKPGGISEDEGYILAQVYDSENDVSKLYVWDAKSLDLLARYDNQVDVPYTVHGSWFSNQSN